MYIRVCRSDNICVSFNIFSARPTVFTCRYSGAQVAVASLAVNFMAEQGVGFSRSKASLYFSYCQMTFTFGRYVPFHYQISHRLTVIGPCRFVSVVILRYVDPALLLSIYAAGCCAFSLGVALAPGLSGIGCLFGLFFFESICYPVRPACFIVCDSTEIWDYCCYFLVYFHSCHKELRHLH